MPSWSRVVLDGDPRLCWIHVIDHWKPNRSGASRLARWRRYRGTRRRALREIRAVGYDVAIDLYGYFPNMAFALSRSMIPVRLGFASGGFGSLYTHAFPWSDDRRQVGERQVGLVSMLSSSNEEVPPIGYVLPETPHARTAADRVATILLKRRLERGAYIVIHPGTGDVHREWPVAEWRRLARQLVAEGHRVVLTGRGAREASVLEEIGSGIDDATNLCDALDWHDLVEVVRHARIVISVETATAHVAAAVGTPCVALWSDTLNAQYWRPLGSYVTLVTASSHDRVSPADQELAPMSNVRAISPRDVLGAVHDMLAATARGVVSARPEPKAQGVR
jgi:ADP-heptose:LPS heptosyltransferase